MICDWRLGNAAATFESMKVIVRGDEFGSGGIRSARILLDGLNTFVVKRRRWVKESGMGLSIFNVGGSCGVCVLR